MHRQVQEVLKDEMDQPARRPWAERVVATLADIFPSPDFRNWPQCEKLLPHARAASRHIADFGLDSEAAGLLLNKTAYYLDASRRTYRSRAPPPARPRHSGENAGPRPSRCGHLAQQPRGALPSEKGVWSCRAALPARPRHPRESAGPRPSRCGHSPQQPRAAVNQAKGEYGRAEPLYQRGLAIKEKALGPDHPDVAATSLSTTSRCCTAAGRLRRAEPLYLRALAIHEKALGPAHPDVATSLNNLALLYQAKGEYGRAEPLYQRALAIKEKALGLAHPDVATSLNNLAALYHR